MLWNTASSEKEINELSEPLATSFERLRGSGELPPKKWKREKGKCGLCLAKIRVNKYLKSKAMCLWPFQRQAAESPAFYLAHRVNTLLGCHTEEESKEQKTDKLYMGQWPNCGMEEQHFSASWLLSQDQWRTWKFICSVENHIQGEHVPKRSAPHEVFGFIFNPFNNSQKKTINNTSNQNFTFLSYKNWQVRHCKPSDRHSWQFLCL